MFLILLQASPHNPHTLKKCNQSRGKQVIAAKLSKVKM